MTCLLGLPDIVKLGLQINFGVLKDTSSQNPNFMNIQQISHETELSVFKTEITNKESNEMKGAPKIMFFTPLHKIHVPENTLISISLICNNGNIGDYLYFRCLVWDCNCIKKVGDDECKTCELTQPIFSGLITPQRTIHIVYKSEIACVLEPNVDMFTVLVNPNVSLFNKYMKIRKKINAITVEAPGFILSDDEIFF